MKHRLINFPCRLPVIGIAGPAGSGKNEVADIISRHYDCVQYSFAAPIKQMLQMGLGLTRQDTDGYRKEQPHPLYGKTPRQLMQTLGTEWGRNMVHPDVWVTATADYCSALHLENQRLAILLTDVRFNNEADWVRNQGGIIIHVERPDAAPVTAHASEQGVQRIDYADFVIPNDSDLLTLSIRTLDLADRISQNHRRRLFNHAS